ncbi:MAG: hypothetical protein ABIJ08_01485 [Nanoarchaeota archaeon]
MKFGNKEFKEYWKIIKIPTYILVGWSIVGFILSIIAYDLYSSVFTGASGWVLMLSVFGFIGWSAIKDYKKDINFSAWSGAISGAISGMVGAVIAIIMFFTVPEILLAAASQANMDTSTLQSMMQIGVYIGLVTGPLISGLIGSLISAISAAIAKKIK